MEALLSHPRPCWGSSPSQDSQSKTSEPQVSGSQASGSQISIPLPPRVTLAGVDSLDVQLQTLAISVASLQASVVANSTELSDLRPLRQQFETARKHAKDCRVFYRKQFLILKTHRASKDAMIKHDAPTLGKLVKLALRLAGCLPDWYDRWITLMAARIRATHDARETAPCS